MLIAFGVAMIGFTVFVTWYTRTNNLFDDLGGSFVALTPILILGAIIFGIYLVALGIAKLRQLKHLNQ